MLARGSGASRHNMAVLDARSNGDETKCARNASDFSI